jgi:hypothetical protein
MTRIGIFLIIFVTFFYSSAILQASCVSRDQSQLMCKGFGFCTMFPLGLEGESCGKKWTIPENWKAMSIDCLRNAEDSKTYSCENGGKISTVICGKSNCYVCKCN